MMAQRNITDRALRYRAQNNVTGPKRCVLCGSTSDVGVMHLDGNESHGERANLAWGCRSCNQKLAAAFKRIGAGRPTNQYNPSKGVPTFDQYAWAVSNHTRGEHDEGGAIIHATPKHKRIEYARRIAGLKAHRGTGRRSSDMPDWVSNPGAPGSAFRRCVRSVTERGGADDPRAVCAAAGREKYGAKEFQAMAARGRKKKHGNPRNPEEAARKMSERFHGRPVIEVKTVDETVHFHRWLAELGTLDCLKVRAMDGERVKLDGFDGALLCCNEDGTQLYIRGGDQAVDCEQFGVEEPYHDKEDLGEVVEIRYFTTKDHLGKDGGAATYYHKFGEDDTAAGRKPRRPCLIYSVRDRRLSLVGGGYKVEAEGIVN